LLYVFAVLAAVVNVVGSAAFGFGTNGLLRNAYVTTKNDVA